MMAPGTILQLMYLRSRVRKWPKNYKTFYDIGSGTGLISNVLLSFGYKGNGFDLNKIANEKNYACNYNYIKEGNYHIYQENFLNAKKLDKVDIIVSSFLIEHLPEKTQKSFFLKAQRLLNRNGIIVTIVPANPNAWGIEDDIAGHLRRYDTNSILRLAEELQLKITFLHGLTWPISNILLPISNLLVLKKERIKLKYSKTKRTIESGFREIKFKTVFPQICSVILNKFVLSPFYFLQLWGKNLKSCLVIYFEMKKNN